MTTTSQNNNASQPDNIARAVLSGRPCLLKWGSIRNSTKTTTSFYHEGTRRFFKISFVVLRDLRGVLNHLHLTPLFLYCSLIPALPELGNLNRQEIAALVGVAPFCNDSGKKSGERHIKGGRANVRSALYMATFNAVHRNPTFKQFFDRLVANGKKYKVALVAAMRKLITTLNTMIKTNTMWNEQRVHSK